MSTSSKIEWTETTWNPVTGCTKVSEGCKNCYAERFSSRLQMMGVCHYKNGFQVTTHNDSLLLPFSWKKPKLIFVNSMSDLFHEDVPTNFIQEVFGIMADCPRHTFQVLTKRSQRLRDLAPILTWSTNIWMGVSVENNSVINRISDLQKIPAAIRFISFEPLLGPIKNFPTEGIGWVIVGGESGPNARKIDPTWIEPIFDTCRDYNIPFFFKQWGGTNKKKTGREFHGREYSERPEIHSLQIPDLIYSE